MSWNPRHAHVSQIHPQTGSGADDCGPASVTRYLYEAGKLAADLDPWIALAEVAAMIRGVPDSPVNNAPTDSNALIAGLAHYGIAASWTDSYQSCLAAAWSIVLVRGPDLVPAPCPQSWWGVAPYGSGDHWMLWLPAWQGSANWFDNPLEYTRGQVDAQYDLHAVQGAFYGGILLPSTGNGETPAAPWRALRQFGLLPRPVHGSAALAVVPNGGTGLVEEGARTDGDGTVWQRVQWRDRHGWAPKEYLQLSP
jgi:hypothetical protein